MLRLFDLHNFTVVGQAKGIAIVTHAVYSYRGMTHLATWANYFYSETSW